MKKFLIKSMIHISWIILFLVIFYYFFIEKIETKVALNGVDYLIDKSISSIRPLFVEMPDKERNSFKMKTSKIPFVGLKQKKFFEGSYGKMRMIILILSLFLSFSLIYFIKNKKTEYIYTNIYAIIISIFVVLTEYTFAGIITPSFYSIDANETLSYAFNKLNQ